MRVQKNQLSFTKIYVGEQNRRQIHLQRSEKMVGQLSQHASARAGHFLASAEN